MTKALARPAGGLGVVSLPCGISIALSDGCFLAAPLRVRLTDSGRSEPVAFPHQPPLNGSGINQSSPAVDLVAAESGLLVRAAK